MTETAKRDYLTGSIRLSRDEDGSSPEEFIVENVIGEGGSCVCYEAIRVKTGEKGKLKEFYPVDATMGKQNWYYSLERLPSGQLIPGAGTIRKFAGMCKEHIATYRLLVKTLAENPENEVLKGYIQHGEVLYGCMDEEYPVNPTVYIWSIGVAGAKFDGYLKEVKKEPEKNPEKKLKQIIEVIYSMTDCIKALHTAGLLHMDIKPENFLVQYNSDFEILPSNISLFDINSFAVPGSEYFKPTGTEGYYAPEILKGKADNRSDIYSIGAMLFNAIVDSPNISDGLYRDQFYSDISYLVQHSSLFIHSEANSNKRLMSEICRILEKCLAKSPRSRYQSCSELRKDFERVLELMKRLEYKTPEKKDKVYVDSMIAIQKLLYDHPLYETEKQKDYKGDIDVLVLGAGTCGQNFIDMCLQAGQMVGRNLHITAVSAEAEDDLESYVRFRPALSSFVNINGSLTGREETAYAVVEFKNISDLDSSRPELQHFSVNWSQKNQDILTLLTEGEKNYDYIFVAMRNDTLNKSVATHFSEQLKSSCPVGYISYQKPGKQKKNQPQNLYPVHVHASMDITAIDPRLGEMAFNTHIAWNDNMDMDVEAEKKKFFFGNTPKARYNRSSSVSYVLSIQYKLYSIGIDVKDMNEAAVRFSEEILKRKDVDPEAKHAFDQLVDLEHRRWLIDRSVEGWTAPLDENGRLKLEDCISRASVKDETNRLHPCIVRGSASSPLSDPAYAAEHYAKWDEGPIDPALDPLDRMSVELHRVFKKYADEIKKKSLLQNPDILYIQNALLNEPEEVQKAFKRYQFALKNIVNGVRSYSLQFKVYEKNLTKAVDAMEEGTKKKILERIAVLRHDFFPVIESNIYRNYKALDEKLVSRIPFILSYRYTPVMAIALEDGKFQNGRNEAVFSNVAAATVLSPEKLQFLYCYTKDTNQALLIHKLDAILNYLGKREVHSGIELVLAYTPDIPTEDIWALQQRFQDLQTAYQKDKSNAWFENVALRPATDYAGAAEAFAEYLKENPADLYNGGTPIVPSAYDNARFIQKLEQQGIPYFEFDWRNKAFTRTVGCEYLQFMEDASFIRIQDMFALMNATDNRFNLPEFSDDYEVFWSIYTGEYLPEKSFEEGVGNWNRLCTYLKAYEDRQPALLRIPVSEAESPIYKACIYYLPEFTYSTVKKMLMQFIALGMAKEESKLEPYTSENCRLELVINEEYEKKLATVFEDPTKLLAFYGLDVLKVRAFTGEYFEIRYNQLKVTDIDLDPDDTGRGKKLYDLLKELEKTRLITQLSGDRENPKHVSFTYTASRIKKLLTSTGEILKIYAYYDILKRGYFDDVACGYELNWEMGEVTNELDLVLTKGFRSMIVACESAVALDMNYYHELHSIADQFGIGTVKVLLGNTYARSNTAAEEANKKQRIRGRQLNILTVSEKEKIIQIGQTLEELMKKS